jgi:hypothetical protein
MGMCGAPKQRQIFPVERSAPTGRPGKGEKIMRIKNALLLAASLGAVALPTAAFAGERIWGSGGTRTAAMDDAERRGAVVAAEKHTCITTHATPQNCSQDSGGWSCWVTVANEQGSCAN